MVNLQEEKERLAREKKEEKERLAKEKAAEKERLAKEKEKERLAKEMEDRNPSDEEEGPKPQLEQQWITRPGAKIVKIIRTENGEDNSRDAQLLGGASHNDQENEGE